MRELRGVFKEYIWSMVDFEDLFIVSEDRYLDKLSTE